MISSRYAKKRFMSLGLVFFILLALMLVGCNTKGNNDDEENARAPRFAWNDSLYLLSPTEGKREEIPDSYVEVGTIKEVSEDKYFSLEHGEGVNLVDGSKLYLDEANPEKAYLLVKDELSGKLIYVAYELSDE